MTVQSGPETHRPGCYVNLAKPILPYMGTSPLPVCAAVCVPISCSPRAQAVAVWGRLLGFDSEPLGSILWEETGL